MTHFRHKGDKISTWMQPSSQTMYFNDYARQGDMKYVPNVFSLKSIDGWSHHASVRAQLHTVIPHKHRPFDTNSLSRCIYISK